MSTIQAQFYLRVTAAPVVEMVDKCFHLFGSNAIKIGPKEERIDFVLNMDQFFFLVYPVSNYFKISQATGQTVYVNDKVLHHPLRLKVGDTIRVEDWQLVVDTDEKVQYNFISSQEDASIKVIAVESDTLSSVLEEDLEIGKDLLPHSQKLNRFCNKLIDNFIESTHAIGGLMLGRSEEWEEIAVQTSRSTVLYFPNLEEIIRVTQFRPSLVQYISSHGGLIYFFYPFEEDHSPFACLIISYYFDSVFTLKKIFTPLCQFLEKQIRSILFHLSQREEVEQELIDAWHQVQAHIIPSQNPKDVSLTLDGFYEPASYLSGDYVDYFLVEKDQRRFLYFTVGDVRGKGTGASLIMSAVQSLFHLLANQGLMPHEIANEINKEVAKFSSFISMVIFRWDEDKKILEYTASGKHFWKYSHRHERIREQEVNDLALGMKKSGSYQTHQMKDFAPRDVLVISTDGTWEAKNHHGEMLGVDGWEQYIASSSESLSESITTYKVLDRLVTQMKMFTEAALKKYDDMTILVVGWPPK